MESREETVNTLTPAEPRVIVRKGTARPFSGEYDDFFQEGTYICRRCNTTALRFERQARDVAVDNGRSASAMRRLMQDQEADRDHLACSRARGSSASSQRVTCRGGEAIVNGAAISWFLFLVI